MLQPTPPGAETVLTSQVVELTGAAQPAPLFHLPLQRAETGSGVGSTLKPETDRLSRVEALVEIFERAKKLLRLQAVGADAHCLQTTHAEVRSAYDDFVHRWGRINAVGNRELFERTSPIGAFLRSLEVPAKGERTRGWEPGALLTDARGVVRGAESRTHAATPEEALLICLAETGGRVSLRRVGELLGVTPDEAFGRLGDLAFRDPGSKRVVTRDEYLSGDIRQKLDACVTAVADGETEYERNVRALEEVLPPAIKRDGVILRLGATWVPQDVVRDFARHLVGDGYAGEVVYNEVLGRWRVDAAGKEVRTSRDATERWGTERLHAIALLDDLLNLRTPEIRDNRGTPDAPAYVTNPVETAAAQAKAEEMRAEFERWAWADDERAARLLAIYNERFNRRRARRFSGAHLALAGMNRAVVPYEHQRDGAWRIMQRPSTALVYKVGYGKTLAGIIAAMELRCASVARQPVAAVPREAFGTWVDQAVTAYPGIRLFAVSERDFRPDRREETLAAVATRDWDLVVMTHEQFERIEVADRTAEFFIHEQRARAEAEIRRLEADRSADYGRDVDALRRHTERLERNLRAKREERASSRHKCGVTWDDIGCDLLLVDEFQAFKGLDVPCRLSGVAGLASNTSERASDMRIKIDQVRRRGGRVAALTGTPITNSLTEAFVLQCFLQPEALEAAGLTRLDAWLANFGEITPATELAPEGTGFRQRTRLRRFQNLPGLSAMLAEVMDVRTDEDVELADVPRRAGGSTINVPVEASDELKRIMRVIAAAAGRIRKGTSRAAAATSNHAPVETISGAPALDNMLALMGVGRRAAVDPRLVDEALTALAANKLRAVADRIMAYYRRTTANLGAQLVFLDQGTPKLHSQHDWSQVPGRRPGDDHLPGLSDGLYPELMAMLVQGGIPAHEVRFIHDVRTLAERRRLEDDVNAGRVRVLLGSTGRMGKAMNAQRRVVAIHHVDPPLRPSDVEQRDGRGLRPGNLYPEVFVLQYVSKGSFDGFVFQLLENKGRVAGQILRGDVTELVTEDVGDCVLTASQAKAIASGDPRVRERIEAEIQLGRLARLRDAFDAEHSRRRGAAEYLPNQISRIDKEIARLTDALAALDEAIHEEEREVARLAAESKERHAAGDEACTPTEQAPVDLTRDAGGGSADAQPVAAGQANEENAGKKKYFRMELAATTAAQPPGAEPLPLAVYNDRAEAGREIARLAVELSADAAQARCQRTAWVGRYRGFLVALTSHPTAAPVPGSIEERHGWSARAEDSLFGRACEILLVPEREARAAGTACECERLYANITATHAGTIASIDAELRGLRARVERRRADRVRLDEDLARARSRLGAGWAHAERYTLLRERLVALTRGLAAGGNDFGEDESPEAVSAKYPPLADGRYWANGAAPGAEEVRLLVERRDGEGEESRTSDIHDYDLELEARDNLLTGLETEPIRVDERTREFLPADAPEPDPECVDEVLAASLQTVVTSPREVTSTAETKDEVAESDRMQKTDVKIVEAVGNDHQAPEQSDGESSADKWFRDLDRLRLTGAIGKRRRASAPPASDGQMSLF